MHSGDSSNNHLARNSWREVLFTDLLRSIRLRASFYFRPELRAPWGLSVADHGTVFHIVAEGHCWLQIKGLLKPVELTAGDFVVLPRGDAHSMCDSPASPIIDFFDMVKAIHPIIGECSVLGAVVRSPGSSVAVCSLKTLPPSLCWRFFLR